MASKPVAILYFAWLRDRVGLAEERISLPETIGTVAALRDWLIARSPRHAAAFAQAALIRCAVNQEIVGLDHAIAPGDEVAFFPPVTGG